MGYTLRDYQEETLQVISQMSKGDRYLIKLPTGAGKTVVFATLTASTNNRVLIVVPSKELREQAYEKIKAIDENLDVGNVQANLNEVESKIVIASRQSLTHKKSNRLQNMLQHGEFEYVVIDEAHQAVDQIKNIIHKINSNAKVIGFTATPYNKDMRKIFDTINFQKDILYMINNEYLCEPKAIMVESNTNLNHVKLVAGEFNQKELEDAVNNVERNQLIVKAYVEFAKDRKSTLVFATGIEHSNSIVREFIRNDIPCKSIDSTMNKDDRENILEEFTSGKIPVLVNVAVLTTGFDHPETDCIILARPTKSKILYEQIIGRGLRTSEGKGDCLIVDINDVVKNHDLMSLSTVFDMKIMNGETPKTAAIRNAKEKADEEERLRQEQIRLEEEQRKKEEEIKLKAQQVKLFNRDMQNRIIEANYDWFKVDLMTYALTYTLNSHYVVLSENDEYICYRCNTEKNNKKIEFVTKGSHLQAMIKHIETKLIRFENGSLSKDAEWKKQPATENQKKYLSWASTKWDAHTHFTGNTIKGLLKHRDWV